MRRWRFLVPLFYPSNGFGVSVVLGLFFAGHLTGQTGAADDPAARVIILANAEDAESLELAHYYARGRHIPEANIVALALPREETIAWSQFIERLWNPLQEKLVLAGWLSATPLSGRDEAGRRRYHFFGHRLTYLVLCRGVPLRLEHDAQLAGLLPPVAPPRPAPLQTLRASVDSELALLAQSTPPIAGWWPNPLFEVARPTAGQEQQVVKVARLDGPTQAAAKALVDHALQAERRGLIGRAYVDAGGPYPEGDQWMEATARQLLAAGFETEVDHAPAVLAPTARFDAPIWYFGWYANDLTGPMAAREFQFPPGAVALHLHSFSAQTLRRADVGWCGPLVARGITATVGNVFEPYLPYTHRPSWLVQALLGGERWGDVACGAAPVLGWQGVVLGDPLYRPGAVSLAQQWAEHLQHPGRADAYLVARKARQLVQVQSTEQALALLRNEFARDPSLSLALTLATCLRENGARTEAVTILQQAATLPVTGPDADPALWAQVARDLLQLGEPAPAVALYRRILAQPLDVPARALWQREALLSAVAAGDENARREWAGDSVGEGKGSAN